MTTAPMNPLAGPSGPSKFSTRTDKLTMGSTSYGEGVETAAIKSGAPLANTPDVKGQAPSKFREELSSAPVTELFAPTERPGEAITTGIARGAGAGPEVLMMQSQFAQRKISDILAEMIPYDNTGEVAILYQNAIARGN
jgi:hypothetical protein